jgi:multidrug efflux system membrane fusion protein
MKKSYILALLLAVAAGLWVVSGVLAPAQPEAPAPAEAGPDASAAQVRVRDSVAEKMTAHVAITGRSQAARRVDIKTEIAGQVVAIVVEKGAAVKEGDVIARIDERDRRARLAETKERVRQREIEYNAARELEEKGFNSKVKLASARADLEAARTALRKAEIELANTEIKAPFDGIIADQRIEIGNYVETGTVAFSIVDLDPIELSGFVTEKQVIALTPGGPVKAQLLNGIGLEGALTYIAPTADPATRTFRIEVAVPNPDMRVLEGLTATLRLPIRETMAHRISPSILTLDDTGRIGVKTVNDANKVEFLPVTIIADEPDHMWIGNLPDRVRLITVGQDYVTPGQTVDAVKSEEGGLL